MTSNRWVVYSRNSVKRGKIASRPMKTFKTREQARAYKKAKKFKVAIFDSVAKTFIR